MNSGSTTAPKAQVREARQQQDADVLAEPPDWFGLRPSSASDRLRRRVDAFDQVRLSHRRSVRSSYRACLEGPPDQGFNRKSLDWAEAAPERSMTLPARYFY